MLNAIGETHLVGEIQLNQFVVNFQGAFSRAEAYHTAAFLLDATRDLLGHIEGGVCGTLVGGFGHFGVHALESRERGQFQFTFGTVVPLRHLVKANA